MDGYKRLACAIVEQIIYDYAEGVIDKHSFEFYMKSKWIANLIDIEPEYVIRITERYKEYVKKKRKHVSRKY